MGSFSDILQMFHSNEYWKGIIDKTRNNEYLTLNMLIRLLPLVFDYLEPFDFFFWKTEETLPTDQEDLDKVETLLQNFLEEFEKEEYELTKDIFDNESLFEVASRQNKESDIQATTEDLVLKTEIRKTCDNILVKQIASMNSWLVKNILLLEYLEELCPDLSWDYSQGDLQKEYFSNLEKYSRLVENLPQLKTIVDMLGRIEIEIGQKSHEVKIKAPTHVRGVTLSSNINNLLVSELALLLKPETKKLFYAKLTEQRLLSYKLEGELPYQIVTESSHERKRGSVVALIDTSGSMSGFPEEMAKALMLAIAKTMLKDKRDVKVILFSSRDEIEEIELTKRKTLTKEFLEFLSLRFGGGTDFNTALKYGLKSVAKEEFELADLLFITDGGSIIDDEDLLADLKKWKEQKEGRVFTVILEYNDAGGLKDVSDYVYSLKKKMKSGFWDPKNSPAIILKKLRSKDSKITAS